MLRADMGCDDGAMEDTVNPTLTYDKDANAAYLRFSDAAIVESEEVSDGIVLDYDAEGHIVGLEVLDADRHLPPETLKRAA